MVNPIFDDYFTNITHDKATRNNSNILRLPHVKLEVAKQSFFFGGAKLYNTLPIEVRSTKNIDQFKACLKEILY